MSARLTAGFTALMTVLGTAAVTVPSVAVATWALAGALGIAAVLFGVWRHRPVPRTPWLLLAAGLFAQAAGDVIFAAAGSGAGGRTPIAAELCYLAMFPLLAVGLLQLTRPSVLLRDRSALIDLLTLALVAGLVLWVLVIAPALTAPRLGAGERSLLATYALGDLLLVATMVALLLTVRRSPAVVLLVVGSGGLLAADLLYAAAELDAGWRAGGLPELGWLLLYAGWGAAALQPSMARLAAPSQPSGGDVGFERRTLLVLCCLVPPALLLMEAMRGRVDDGVLIAVVSALLFGLLASRLTDAVDTHRSLVRRERHLREACVAMVPATDADAIGHAVRGALEDLMPPGAGHRVVFAVEADNPVPIAAAATWGVHVPHQYRAPAGAASRRTRLLRTFTLHPGLIEELGGYPVTLVCPLVLDAAVSDAPRFGALFVAARAEVLEGLQDAIEVLAAQATLALARILVTDQMHRTDREQYFRAIAQNTGDVVLIVDDDDRVRYASPSLADLVGTQAVPFAPLTDIFHADGHDQVVATLRRVRAARDPEGVRRDWLLLRPDGTRLTLEVSCRDLRDDRMVQGMVITMRDVTARRVREREIIRRAVLDSAPGRNRRSVANRFRSL